MKKRLVAVLLVAVMAASMTACSNDSGNANGTETVNASTENSSANESAAPLTEEEVAAKYPFINYSGKKSSEYELNFDEIIKELPNYKGLEFELDAQYEVTEDAINGYFATVLTQFNADSYKEVTDRDVVEANDYVKLDYTGYKDDVAFDGGAATDVMIDIAGNKQVGQAYGFIDGFTSGIPGAKVGETIKCPVTFPENYGNEDLNGQEVIFEFKIKAIYSQESKKIDEFTDAEVSEVFGEAGFTTNAALKEQLIKDLNYNLENAMTSEITNYLLENTSVDIPSDYLDARCFEMYSQAKIQYATDTQTLAEVVAGVGMEYGEYIGSMQESVTEQVKMELILGKIAMLENITVDDDEFNIRVNEIVTVNSSMFADETALFNYFGANDVELGKATFRAQLLSDKVTKNLAENSTAKFISK